ncbi:MAG TPA: DUF2933 domain-containing protein [Bacillus sp. (in: firmicutes)]|uniref:DUF2933 domain-containing protein n=1 Tax=Bacillus litorisediminis TaxID=2922713 RepID=UPI001FAE9795|nr:DUF2933 domain-containing protein [Bacillus litorisediminis]HWO76939.1 DUF2933 domain-containing protein [Bacillus sp. (in: firmicutes)]
MEWFSNLLLLLCPLMMIFCMKGMGGYKHHHSHSSNDMDIKISKLELENEELRKEINSLSAKVQKDL